MQAIKKVVNNSFGKYFPWKLSFNFCLRSTFFLKLQAFEEDISQTNNVHAFISSDNATHNGTKNYYVYSEKCIKANNENFQNKQLKSSDCIVEDLIHDTLQSKITYGN